MTSAPRSRKREAYKKRRKERRLALRRDRESTITHLQSASNTEIPSKTHVGSPRRLCSGKSGAEAELDSAAFEIYVDPIRNDVAASSVTPAFCASGPSESESDWNEFSFEAIYASPDSTVHASLKANDRSDAFWIIQDGSFSISVPDKGAIFLSVSHLRHPRINLPDLYLSEASITKSLGNDTSATRSEVVRRLLKEFMFSHPYLVLDVSGIGQKKNSGLMGAYAVKSFGPLAYGNNTRNCMEAALGNLIWKVIGARYASEEVNVISKSRTVWRN